MLEPNMRLEYNKKYNGLDAIIIENTSYKVTTILEVKIILKNINDIEDFYNVTKKSNDSLFESDSNSNNVKLHKYTSIVTKNKIFEYQKINNNNLFLLRIQKEPFNVNLNMAYIDFQNILLELENIIRLIKQIKLRNIINKNE